MTTCAGGKTRVHKLKGQDKGHTGGDRRLRRSVNHRCPCADLVDGSSRRDTRVDPRGSEPAGRDAAGDWVVRNSCHRRTAQRFHSKARGRGSRWCTPGSEIPRRSPYAEGVPPNPRISVKHVYGAEGYALRSSVLVQKSERYLNYVDSGKLCD